MTFTFLKEHEIKEFLVFLFKTYLLLILLSLILGILLILNLFHEMGNIQKFLEGTTLVPFLSKKDFQNYNILDYFFASLMIGISYATAVLFISIPFFLVGKYLWLGCHHPKKFIFLYMTINGIIMWHKNLPWYIFFWQMIIFLCVILFFIYFGCKRTIESKR